MNRQMRIGEKLRELRESKNLLLRQVAAVIEIDTAYLSKMERGEKNFKKEHISKLSSIYHYDENELISIWLADQIIDLLNRENKGIEILKIAEKKFKN